MEDIEYSFLNEACQEERNFFQSLYNKIVWHIIKELCSQGLSEIESTSLAKKIITNTIECNRIFFKEAVEMIKWLLVCFFHEQAQDEDIAISFSALFVWQSTPEGQDFWTNFIDRPIQIKRINCEPEYDKAKEWVESFVQKSSMYQVHPHTNLKQQKQQNKLLLLT